MFEPDEGPGEAATGLTDQFFEAGVAKLDGLFGAGYSKQNPQALAGYIAACASNLNAFMTAATAIGENAGFDDALAALEDEFPSEPALKPKRGRR